MGKRQTWKKFFDREDKRKGGRFFPQRLNWRAAKRKRHEMGGKPARRITKTITRHFPGAEEGRKATERHKHGGEEKGGTLPSPLLRPRTEKDSEGEKSKYEKKLCSVSYY